MVASLEINNITKTDPCFVEREKDTINISVGLGGNIAIGICNDMSSFMRICIKIGIIELGEDSKGCIIESR